MTPNANTPQPNRVIWTDGKTTVRHVKQAQQQGPYTPTGIDTAKAAAGFRVVDVSGTKNRIIWSDGRAESVTDARLEKLQALHSWAPDF